MIDQKTADKVKPIDPEPLLEAMKQEPPKPKPVDVPQPQPEQPPPPPPAPPAQREAAPMQVVETAKPSEEKAPDNARFLAEYDTNVEEADGRARRARRSRSSRRASPRSSRRSSDPKEASVQGAHRSTARRRTEQGAGRAGLARDAQRRAAGAARESSRTQKVRGSTTGASGSLAFDGYVPRKGDGAIEQQQHESQRAAARRRTAPAVARPTCRT